MSAVAAAEVHEKQSGSVPRILVFSTNNISDPGIDLAGSQHMHYSPGVEVISMPCTSGIKPVLDRARHRPGVRRRVHRVRRRRVRLPARLQQAGVPDRG